MKVKAFLLLAVIAIILLGCKDSGNNLLDGQIIKNDESEEIVKHIAVPILNYRTLNPILSKDESTFQMNHLIYDSLIDIDESLIAVPSLAKNWRYSDDDRTLFLYLEEDVKWHDGNDFKAEDVVFTIYGILNSSGNSSQYYSFIKNIQSAEKIDNHTVKITFKTAYDNAIENFTFPILSHALYNSYKDVAKAVENYVPIGTGPYVVSAIEKSKNIQLVKNENYWGEQVPINDITLEIVPSLEDSIGLLEIHDIQMTVSRQSDWNKYLQNKGLFIKDFVSNEVEVLGFNHNNALLSSRDVRQAIAYAIDTGEIIDSIYLGSAIESDTPYRPHYLGANDVEGHYEKDLKKSRELLNNAGFSHMNEDGYLLDEKGKIIKLNILTNYENTKRMDTAEIIKKHLKSAGIAAEINYINYDQFSNRISKGQYDMYLGGFAFSHVMDLRFILSSKLDNPTNYKNDYLDHLLVEMQRHLPLEKKQENFKEVRDILVADLPFYTLLYKKDAIIADKNMKGDIHPNFINLYEGIESWYIENK
ncbi:MAG: peptide ABC transporter substrate-binding protein [Peptostreptococcales bacterium]